MGMKNFPANFLFLIYGKINIILMRIKEVLTEQEDKLIDYWMLSKEKYDMLMQELVDEGYDIDELTRDHW